MYPSVANFPSGFQSGFTVRGMPVMQTHPGRVWWVGNSATLLAPGGGSGANGNAGTFQRPFSTIQRGLDLAASGDIVMVRPGHAETIADAATLTLNKAGVAVIGLGYGSLRPTLTFTAAAANIPVTAANQSIQNLRFVANFADVASFMTATGTNTPTGLSIEQCVFLDTSSILNALTVFTGNATANSCDGFRFYNCRVKSLGTTAATTALKILSDTDDIHIANSIGVAAVLNDTAALLAASTFQLTSFFLNGNRWERPNTSSTGGSFVSGSGNAWTGMAYDNHFWQVDNTAGIWIATGHGSAFGFHNNFSPVTGAVDKSALINPVAV